MLILIKGGHVIDPGRWDGRLDILIKDGRIIEIEPPVAMDKKINACMTEAAVRVFDASDKIVSPGLIDMHVHLREPGHEHKETIQSGCLAAVHGGFTTICCMPNTIPVNDNRTVTTFINRKAQQAGAARVYPIAAISKGLCGKQPAQYGELKAAGAVGLTDDGFPVMDEQLMRRAMEHAQDFDLPLIAHCEDLRLTGNGVMNAGSLSTQMGLPGIPNMAESAMVTRDIALCEQTGARLHIAHVSTRQSVRAIRDAKARGLPISAETAPHYFILTEEAVRGYNTNAKMNPPLRSSKDVAAVREGLTDGTIDVIASDHAPHSGFEKEVEFKRAANGIIGLETSLPLSLILVDKGVLTLEALVQKMSVNPARILGLENCLQAGRPADLTIIDMDTVHRIEARRFRSLSRNTPFDGWRLRGKAVLTMVGGKIVFNAIAGEINSA